MHRNHANSIMSRLARHTTRFKIVCVPSAHKEVDMATAIIRRQLYSSTFISDTLSKPITTVNKFPASSAFRQSYSFCTHRSATFTFSPTHRQPCIHIVMFASENTNTRIFNSSTITNACHRRMYEILFRTRKEKKFYDLLLEFVLT